ncbi:uncharacterized protein LOC112505999 [Cynara cardunculus var. scolymus]|uniref:uncharacterized protein LOC112505999 n=1 Tax=Cynara cardunculus var. scolymus TaxID=59895 RepID=UPI000D626F86|nr:uncharacterized protein LOC112505999 [Cynara cardunculus var. scolymus]
MNTVTDVGELSKSDCGVRHGSELRQNNLQPTMSGGGAPQPPAKEPTSLTFQFPILSSTNYTIWRMRMEVLLGIHGVWEVVDPGLDYAKKNNIVKVLLFQSIPEDEARLQTLTAEFESMKITKNGTLDDYAAKISALEQVLDLKTIGFEDVVRRLKAYEERIKGEDKVIETQGKLLYSKTESSNRNRDSSRGRGNTQNHGYPQPPKNRENQNQKGKQREQIEHSNIQCYRCDKYGHFASRCPDRTRNHEANLNETQEEDMNHEEGTFFMMNAIQETMFLNEAKYIPPKVEPNTDKDGVWYLDNGASNHMTGNYSYFSELNERITGRVRFGDGSCVGIKGKRSILFEGKNGEQKLMENIYLYSIPQE